MTSMEYIADYVNIKMATIDRLELVRQQPLDGKAIRILDSMIDSIKMDAVWAGKLVELLQKEQQ